MRPFAAALASTIVLSCETPASEDGGKLTEPPVTAETALPTDTAPPLPPGEWVQIGDCEVWMGAPALPVTPPVPASCDPAGPGWVSGPVAGWAQARLEGVYRGDHLGYDLAAVDPDGDGQDALAVGAPLTEIPPTGTCYTCTYLTPPPLPAWSRVHLLSNLQGVVSLDSTSILMAEDHAVPSIGESVEALSETGPVLIGDYWQAGVVHVVDASTEPHTESQTSGLEENACGADVGAADVDGSGTSDIVASCFNVTEPFHIEVYSKDSGQWQTIGWLQGTTPYAWFGRPTVSGFDLDGDGLQEMAVGEQHIDPYFLASAVHLLPRPWRGSCSLQDLGAKVLWNDFVAARLTSGDLDGDGVGELVVTNEGMPSWSLHPNPTPGWVRVIRDPVAQDGAAEDVSWLVFEGLEPEEGFGMSAATGDFNGDGCTDMAVGAGGSLVNAHNPPGRVYVFYGPFDGGTVSKEEADVVLEGAVDLDSFGFLLETGDFNGDGIDDLAVSAIYDSQVAQKAGKVYVLAGVAGTR